VYFQKWSLSALTAETLPLAWTLVTEPISTLSTETKKIQVNHSGAANAVRMIETTKTNMTEYELTKKLETIKMWAEHLIANSRPPENPGGESAYYCAKAFLETELKGIVSEEAHK
jgi:hypothetical protein